MAQDHFASLEGKRVAITNLQGAFRRCQCGHGEATVSTAPVGMHDGHLTCTRCERVTAWLSRDHLSAMLAAEGASGEGQVV